MYKLGITGGIGSGKSTAAKFFVQKGAVVFDADVEAKHNIQETESLQKLIIHNFGSQITTNNHLDLNKLSEIQAKAIIEMRLRQLTGLEQEKLREENNELLKTIAGYKKLSKNNNIFFGVN